MNKQLFISYIFGKNLWKILCPKLIIHIIKDSTFLEIWCKITYNLSILQIYHAKNYYFFNH